MSSTFREFLESNLKDETYSGPSRPTPSSDHSSSIAKFETLLGKRRRQDSECEVPYRESIRYSPPPPLPSPSTPTGSPMQASSSSAITVPDYGDSIMATAILNREDDLPSPDVLGPSDLDDLLKEATEMARAKVFRDEQDQEAQDATSSSTGTFESILVPGKDGYLHPFGESHLTHMAKKRAFVKAAFAQDALGQLETKLSQLSDESCASDIQMTLREVEDTVQFTQEYAASIKQSDLTRQITEASNNRFSSLHTQLKIWRKKHPDTTPLRIDNRKALMNPGARHQTPTLIAYCIALVNRVFEGAAERGAGFMLKALKLFGLSMTLLNPEGANILQRNAISAIPESITTLEERLNLGIASIPYAVCPTCSFTYPPSFSAEGTDPIYPSTCSHKRTPTSELCSTPLLQFNKPIKSYHYYPFTDWFGKFIALPGIEQYGDSFCDDVTQSPDTPMDKRDARDGSFIRDIPAADGTKFIVDRGEEGRWLFRLHGDSFNVEGNRIRGRNKSTGVMALFCVNLPLQMANDPAYIYIPGIIQGPQEPNSKEAAHCHYLKPLITDLEIAYCRGLAPYATYSAYRLDKNSLPYARTFRAAIANDVMDFKAARPYAGLLDVTSHHFCFICKCWHTAHLGRTDYENWEPADDEFLKNGAHSWRDAESEKDRKLIEQVYGTRYSELWRLPYWRPSKQVVVDPMHTIFQRVESNFFRVALSLDQSEEKRNKEERTNFVAFYYDFTPPPHPSIISSRCEDQPSKSVPDRLQNILESLDSEERNDEGQRLLVVEWGHLSAELKECRIQRMISLKDAIWSDVRAFQDIYDIHTELSARAPETTSEGKAMCRRLKARKWNALAYVCNDLMVFPRRYEHRSLITKKDLNKEAMARALVKWRLDFVEEQQFRWPFFIPRSSDPPSVTWAKRPLTSEPTFSGDPGSLECNSLSVEDRSKLFDTLNSKMNYHAAYAIGHIHRKLQQPFVDDTDGRRSLKKYLEGKSLAALMYVCIDINRLPVGKLRKDQLIQQLISWRRTKPHEKMEWADIDSDAVLQRVQEAIRDIITPTWLSKPPPDVGLPKAGTLKADHWRTLFSVYLPLALLSLWKVESPISSEDISDQMDSVLETSMSLTCASIIMAKTTLTLNDRDLFRQLLRAHVIGLQKNFPGFLQPSHHLAFHIYDCMESFSTIRNWWAFAFERLIGKLQRIPTNHIVGQLEKTILHAFNKGAAFRQWLLRTDCPPLLRYCQKILDKAYGYDSTHAATFAPNSSESFDSSDGKLHAPFPSELRRLLHTEEVGRYSSIPAPRGFYTTANSKDVGNSYICFRSGNQRPEDSEWFGGQIQHIYTENGHIRMAIKRCKLLSTVKVDPFMSFYARGFQAKMVSSSFSKKLEIVNVENIVAHTARWEICPGVTVLLNLSRVSVVIMYFYCF